MALIEKLTAIANKIRALDGTTAKKTLDEMADSVDEANAEITTQAAKIAELSTILDGKAVGESNTDNEDGILNRSITAYSNNRITTLGRYAFCYAISLISLSLPNVTTISSNACYVCSKLTDVHLPLVENIGSYSFQSCSALVKLELPKATSIGVQAFTSCSKLTALIIRTNSVCTLANTSAFSSTPIASGTGYVYVPSSLVNSYKVASNWSTYANQIRAIEDYPDVTGG